MRGGCVVPAIRSAYDRLTSLMPACASLPESDARLNMRYTVVPAVTLIDPSFQASEENDPELAVGATEVNVVILLIFVPVLVS